LKLRIRKTHWSSRDRGHGYISRSSGKRPGMERLEKKRTARDKIATDLVAGKRLHRRAPHQLESGGTCADKRVLI
jgi:hypothetical protein